MTAPPEFRRQIFRSPAHWSSGVSSTLRRLAGGGVALFSRPAFAQWMTQDAAARGVRALAVDDCGRLFWMQARDGVLYRRDPVNELVEAMVPLAGRDGTRPADFARMLSHAGRLWLLDRAGSRLLAVRPDTFQIITEIALTGAVDVAFAAGRLFCLTREGILTFEVHGRPLGGPYRDEHVTDPLAVGADPRGRFVYVIDGRHTGFLRFAAEGGAFDTEIGDFREAKITPRLLVVDPDGNLFVSDGSPVLHEFAEDGGYVGPTDDVGLFTAIHGLAVDDAGALYVGTPAGIARFNRAAGIAGNKGQFYTRTLDNGSDPEAGWQRVDLDVELDAAGAVDVYYASAGDAGLAAAVSGIFGRPGSSKDRIAALERVLGDLWKGPQRLQAESPAGASAPPGRGFAQNMSHSVLFRDAPKRYLWIKLELSGLAPRATAAVREMRVVYPRLTYLRYLPAVYQHDPVSQELLGRFLSMFETVFGGVERTIERIPESLDPDLTPAEFLDWLAQWLDLVVEEDWPEAVRRELIANAAWLYQRKGTPEGLAAFIEVVTGTRPVIRESFQSERPLILGDGAVLGVDSRVFRRPTIGVRTDQRTVLGASSVLGTTEIRASTRIPADPFQASAHRFTLVLDMPRHRFQRYARGLHRIVRENAPADAIYQIRLASDMGLGPNHVVGINTRLTDPQPLRLGYSTLGRSICARRVWYGPEIGVDTTLAGPAHEPNRASGLPDGEP